MSFYIQQAQEQASEATEYTFADIISNLIKPLGDIFQLDELDAAQTIIVYSLGIFVAIICLLAFFKVFQIILNVVTRRDDRPTGEIVRDSFTGGNRIFIPIITAPVLVFITGIILERAWGVNYLNLIGQLLFS